jgi:hypothetical protein
MNRANQQQITQQANQEVINIRQTELNYFINLFNVFGTNAAIMGGFTFGILTQNIINYANKEVYLYKYCYYVLAALTIASSVHVMLTTMLVQVYGPGLALHGPLGSMAKAAEGMKEEQKQIGVAVITMVVAFASSTMWLFFCVMTVFEAVASTAIFVIAIRFWYVYCERIYLRFYWKTEVQQWDGQGERDSRLVSEDDNPANLVLGQVDPNTGRRGDEPQYKRKKGMFSMKWAFGGKSQPEGHQDEIELENNQNAYGNGIFNSIFRNPAKMTEEQRRESISGASTAPGRTPLVKQDSILAKQDSVLGDTTTSSVAMEGYFTARGRAEQQVRKWVMWYCCSVFSRKCRTLVMGPYSWRDV